MKTGKRIAPRKSKTGSAGEPTPSGKAPRKRKSRTKTVLLILGGVLLVSAGLLAYFFWPQAPVIPPIPSEFVTRSPGTQGSDAPSGSPAEGTEGPALKYNPDVRTVLAIGMFDGSNTDTIMLASINFKKNTLDVLSIPRDTTIEFNGKRTKINAVHARGGGEKDGAGMAALTAELKNLLGIIPGSTIKIRANAFKDGVDTIGGVKFTVPMDIYKPEEGINLKAGEKTLNGEQALMLMRFRGYSSNNKAGVAHDDFGRIQMQQEFLMAAAKQVFTVKNATKIPEFVNIFNENVTTSLNTNEMSWFADKMMDIMKKNPDGINFHTLPTKSVEKSYEYMMVPEALELLNATINPYTTPITEDMIRCVYPAK